MFKSSELAFSFTVPVCKLQTTESAVSPSRRQLFVFGLGYVGLPYAEAMGMFFIV